MNPEIKDKWLRALRSGNYSQAKGALRTDDGFCCLGVLCDVVDPTGWSGTFMKSQWNPETQTYEDMPVYGYAYGETLGLTEEVRKVAGLHIEDSEPYVSYKDRNLTPITDLNDSVGLSFNQLADIIEEQL